MTGGIVLLQWCNYLTETTEWMHLTQFYLCAFPEHFQKSNLSVLVIVQKQVRQRGPSRGRRKRGL